MSKETWAIFRGSIYMVSNKGRVKNNKTGKILKPGNSLGYERYNLSLNSKRYNFLGHRLVMECFVGKSRKIVNHINGLRADNRLENLECTNHSGNAMHAIKSGLNKNKGSKAYNAKLTEKIVTESRVRHKNGASIYKLAKEFKVSRQAMSQAIKGITWKHI
jgi:hypothetical protein